MKKFRYKLKLSICKQIFIFLKNVQRFHLGGSVCVKTQLVIELFIYISRPEMHFSPFSGTFLCTSFRKEHRRAILRQSDEQI